MGKFDQRFRPFLVVEAFMKPVSGVHTEVRGWKDEKGSQEVSEFHYVVDRLHKKQLTYAEVIIDINNDKLVKNRLQGDEMTTTREAFDAYILAFYKDKYATAIERGKLAWMAQAAKESRL